MIVGKVTPNETSFDDPLHPNEFLEENPIAGIFDKHPSEFGEDTYEHPKNYESAGLPKLGPPLDTTV